MSDVTTLSSVKCQLGEGPVFCTRRNTLFWFDIIGKKRHAHDFTTGQASVINLPEMSSAMAVIDEQNDLIFTESGLWKHEIATGAFTPVCDIEGENEITRSNDARVHPSGAFWLGTMGKGGEKGAGAYYHFFKGELSQLFDNITVPNATCFSPDGKTAYFTDTATAKLMSVEVAPETGLPVGEPSVFVDHTGKDGGLDGAVCDADGNIWVALWRGACMNCYDPTGQHIKSIPLPALQTTCPVFVGEGRLACTSAMQGMDEEALKADPSAGMTFMVDAGVNAKFDPPASI